MLAGKSRMAIEGSKLLVSAEWDLTSPIFFLGRNRRTRKLNDLSVQLKRSVIEQKIEPMPSG